ncbi:MAG: hypothetical protein RLZZ589_1651, partial [Cyanobacteriota bacterium]
MPSLPVLRSDRDPLPNGGPDL